MTFGHPLFLWAMLAALLPIVIYWLMRFRRQDLRWGANYVLTCALARYKRRVQWLRWLLMGLRMLALALIALFFAAPRPAEPAQGQPSVHRIVVVDGSYSMQAETSLEGETAMTRWDQMKMGLTSLIDTWPDRDTWSLYFLGREPRWVLQRQPVSDRAGGLEAIDALRVGNHRAQLARGLADVSDALEGQNAAVYIFADDQAVSWDGVTETVRSWPTRATCYWINPPIASRHNIAVTEVRLSHERVLRGHPTSVFVAVRNFGDRPVKHLEVSIMADGTFASRESVSLIPGQEAWVHGEVSFDTAGSHYITARLPRDVLPADNVMAAGIDVMNALRIVVLRDPQVERFQSAWPFLEDAAAVSQQAASRGQLDLRLVTDDRVEPALADADVVLLDAGRTLDQRTTDALRRFVRDGGGLVLAAGADVDAGAWNEMLGGSGLLPAPLTRRNIRQFTSDDYVNLERTQLEGEGLRSFEKIDDGDLGEARFYGWYEVGELATDASVMARFSDGSPFALMRRHEMGRTLMLTAGLDGNGNNLVVREFFLPLITELFTGAASGAVHPRTVRTGEPIRCLAPNPRTLKRAAFVEDGSEPRELRVQRRAGRNQVVFEAGARMPGVSSILFETDFGLRRVWFGAQGARVDSDLTPLRAETMHPLEHRWNMTQVRGPEDLRQRERGDTERDYVPWVGAILLLACFGEVLLGRAFA